MTTPRSSTSATAAIDVRALVRPDGGDHRIGSEQDAYVWCETLARTHYENFPVASRLAPASLRKHLAAVYAIARLGDDVGDEPWTDNIAERISALAFLDDAVDDSVDTNGHPIFTALRVTMAEYDLPPTLFHRLFEAFRRDVTFDPPRTWQDVLEYCHYSANPVGELVLRLDGIPSGEAVARSNDICTALQVVNFLQDVSVDRARGRDYLPTGIDDAIVRSRELFVRGAAVVQHVRSRRMAWELRAIIAGGSRMLEICAANSTTLSRERPTLRGNDYLRMTMRLATGRWKPRS